MNNDPFPNVNVSLEVAGSAASVREEDSVNRQISFRHRLRRWLWHIIARLFMLFCVIASTIAGWIGIKKRPIDSEDCDILLTGRFDSNNWILAHLVPLAKSKECSRIWMVSTNPVPAIPKVEAIYPPKWLLKSIGTTPSRLLTFLWAAIRKRPHIVGGFHIMVNGIAAIIVGRLIGAKSMYFCVGGQAEIQDGGVHSADSWFRRIETPDIVVEQRLLRLLANCDTIVNMGHGAVKFFRDKGINTDFHVIPGGIDSKQFQPAGEKPLYDCIMTGRIVEIKRIDILLQAVKLVADKIPQLKVLITGDGNLLADLKQMTCDLDINNNVIFTGHQNNVEHWLQKSKIFILTSDSEGLSLSMMEAMMCGLPVIVSNVGDLKDLVEDGVNGFLVPRRCHEIFAARIFELLTDENKLRSFSNAARNGALKHSIQSAVEKWDNIIRNYRSH